MQSSLFQHTLRAPAVVSGVGVHSGAAATLTLMPASPGTGIVFVRDDVSGADNVVPARWDLVVDARLCTVLSNAAGTRVSTVEHVLSACAALGLDNAVIHVDGPEIPIMDGSAAAFIAAIDTAGLRRLPARRQVLRVKKPVSWQEGDKAVTLSPANGAYYGFEIAFDNPVIGRQKYTHRLDEKSYRKDIAAARTFGFLHEVEQLRKAGLARGGSLDNAIVVDGDKVLNPGGLRFPNEFVRHKILDAIGDLFLCGYAIEGHYQGLRAGHALNNRILRVLFSRPDAYEIVPAGTADEICLAPAPLYAGARGAAAILA